MTRKDTTVRTLANGVQIVAIPMPGTPLAAVLVHIRAGSRDERRGEAGAAHLLEHMLFRGSSTRSAEAFDGMFDDIGGTRSAATSYDFTILDATVMAGDVGIALDAFAGIARDNLFDDVDREKEVVLQEIACDRADGVMNMMSNAYPAHAIGRSVLGTNADVLGLRPEDLRRFRNRSYRPDLMTVVVSGGIDAAATLDIATRHFGTIGTSSRRLPTTVRAPVYIGGDDRTQLYRSTLGEVAVGFPGHTRGSRGDLVQGVVCEILSGGMGSRLYNELRVKRSLVYGFDVCTAAYSDGGAFAMTLTATGRTIAEATKVAVSSLGAIGEGVGTDELHRAKTRMVVQIARDMGDRDEVCMSAVADLQVHGSVQTLEEKVADIRSVSAAEVSSMVRSMAAARPTVFVRGAAGRVVDADGVRAILR